MWPLSMHLLIWIRAATAIFDGATQTRRIKKIYTPVPFSVQFTGRRVSSVSSEFAKSFAKSIGKDEPENAGTT